MECQGSCEHHGDIVVSVIVKGGFCGEDGLSFNYCQEAILTDLRAGFSVGYVDNDERKIDALLYNVKTKAKELKKQFDDVNRVHKSITGQGI